MKAIRIHEFGGPEVLKYEDAPDPTPGPGQVVVKVHAIGVNPYEAYIRAGTYGPLTFPFTPGGDAGGEIASVGDGVTGFAVGERVYTAGTISGSYAEMALCDAGQVFHLPPNVSTLKGAGVFVPYATAYRALFQRAQARPGETVLVHGASGGVGIAAVQIALAHGLTVIGTAGTPEGRTLVQEQGAHLVLDHKAVGYLDEVKAFAPGGKGVDVILEMLANVNLGRDLTALAPGGEVVVIGSRGTVEIDPRDLMGRDAAVFGMSLFNASAEDMAAIHAALYAGLQNDSLRPVIGTEIPLAEAARAQREILENPAYGKIVLVP